MVKKTFHIITVMSHPTWQSSHVRGEIFDSQLRFTATIVQLFNEGAIFQAWSY